MLLSDCNDSSKTKGKEIIKPLMAIHIKDNISIMTHEMLALGMYSQYIPKEEFVVLCSLFIVEEDFLK
jgi:hypothetical protein